VGSAVVGQEARELFRRAGIIEMIVQLEILAMGRYLLLWLLGIPIPILILIWAFGGFH